MIYSFSRSFAGLPLTCALEDGAVVGLRFEEGADTPDPPEDVRRLWRRVEWELSEYFAGERRTFDLPLRPEGTPFQHRVWEELLRIPCGETRSYSAVAALIGSPKAARAVGMACHDNPICVLIPCHRVLSASGTLTGFAGGVEVKEKLLCLEGARVKCLK